jgi:predicted short-subunit dehydrogenase-like oxidoreductase (DUF2520 family)
MKVIENIVLVGTGNVATHLSKAILNAGIRISGVWSRDYENAHSFAENISSRAFKNINEASKGKTDLVLICVKDDALREVLQKIDSDLPVAYTSGSVGLELLPKRDMLGVFYPLQTFSKDKLVEFSSIPILLESSSTDFSEALFELATKISNTVEYADSQDRFQLHIAAVMVNNFTNHLVDLAQTHAHKHHLDFELLHPLLFETVDKLKQLKPSEAQTGPAKRGDTDVIEKQMNSLQGRTKEIYKLLSESIMEKHKQEK